MDDQDIDQVLDEMVEETFDESSLVVEEEEDPLDQEAELAAASEDERADESVMRQQTSEKEVISIKRIMPEAEDVEEELPDFETVDAALEKEIAEDTVLVEETELASEWGNVTILGRPSKPGTEEVDLVAEELGGEDPFEEYRMPEC